MGAAEVTGATGAGTAGAMGVAGGSGAKLRIGAGAGAGTCMLTGAGGGAMGLTACTGLTGTGAAGVGVGSALLKLKPNSSAVCCDASGEMVLTATGGLTGAGCAMGTAGTGDLTAAGTGCATGVTGADCATGATGRTRAATDGMGCVAGAGCWGRTGAGGVPNGCARNGGWDDATGDGGAGGGATGECVTGAWTRAAGAAGSAGALSVLVEMTTLVWPPKGPGTSGGMTTCFWDGRRASKAGFSRERISCRGNSTSVRSRSFSAVKVPGGAACRNSPKEIFTVPWVICERIFCIGTKSSASPTSICLIRCMRSAGRRPRTDFKGMAMLVGTGPADVPVRGGNSTRVGVAGRARGEETGLVRRCGGGGWWNPPGAATACSAFLPKSFLRVVNIFAGCIFDSYVMVHRPRPAGKTTSDGCLNHPRRRDCVYFLLEHHSHSTLANRSEPLLAGRKRAMTSERFAWGVDVHRNDIWPLFEHRRVFSKVDQLSHGWTEGVYNAANLRRIPRAVAAGEKSKPSTGPLYEIKLQSPKTGMLLA